MFNGSPEPRTDVVRIPLEAFPPWRVSVTRFDMHPLAGASLMGFAIDGAPVRVVSSDDPTRVRFFPGMGDLEVEFVARDVPAFGCRRASLTPIEHEPDDEDGGREIGAGDVRVRAPDADGTLSVTFDGRTYDGMFGIEDCVDRGDSYDADPDPPRTVSTRATVRRQRHPSGIARLVVTRELEALGTLTVHALVAPGVPFVRCAVTLDNRATDHRLRLRFPTGAPIAAFTAATTFDTARRTTARPDDARWVHRAPTTFAHQGWLEANGLVVGAPGLPEAEVTPDGDVLVTFVRSVGMLARTELRTRPIPAGPEMPAPGAQALGPIHAVISLSASARDARAAEVGLWGVIGGETPALHDGESLLQLAAETSILSACKPARDGDGIIVRVVNPTDETDRVTLRFGVGIGAAGAVQLDETPASEPLEHDGRTVAMTVPPHALRTVRVQTLRR